MGIRIISTPSKFLSDEDFSLLIKEEKEVNRVLRERRPTAGMQVLFKGEHSLEYLGEKSSWEALRELRKRGFFVQVVSGSQPGFPYFRALVTLIPAGVGVAVLKGIRDLILAWLKERSEREVEIKLRGGISVRLKGAHATAKNIDAMIEKLEAKQQKKRLPSTKK